MNKMTDEERQAHRDTRLRELKEQEDGEAFATTFSNFINSFNQAPRKHAIAKMLREHRSLQQSMMHFFMQWIEGMAANSSDGRNQASVELAKAIMALPERVRSVPKY